MDLEPPPRRHGAGRPVQRASRPGDRRRRARARRRAAARQRWRCATTPASQHASALFAVGHAASGAALAAAFVEQLPQTGDPARGRRDHLQEDPARAAEATGVLGADRPSSSTSSPRGPRRVRDRRRDRRRPPATSSPTCRSAGTSTRSRSGSAAWLAGPHEAEIVARLLVAFRDPPRLLVAVRQRVSGGRRAPHGRPRHGGPLLAAADDDSRRGRRPAAVPAWASGAPAATAWSRTSSWPSRPAAASSPGPCSSSRPSGRASAAAAAWSSTSTGQRRGAGALRAFGFTTGSPRDLYMRRHLDAGPDA